MLNPQVEKANSQLKELSEKFSGNVDIGIIVFLLNKSKFLILSFFFLSLSIAFLYLRYTTPVYVSRAILQINDSEQEQIIKFSNIDNTNNAISEAIEQIRSKVFLKRVVEKLDFSVSYFSEGTFKSYELYQSSPYIVKINLHNNNLYNQKIKVELNNNLSNGILKIGTKTYNFNVNTWLKTNDFDVNIFINPKIDINQAKRVISENNVLYFIVSNLDDVTAKLQSQLEVKLINDLAKTIQLKVSDVNSAKSTDIVNAIIEEFLTFDVERKSESSSNIISFINNQLNLVYNDLKATESNLQKFKKDKNISESDQLYATQLMRVSSIEDQMLKVEMEENIINEIQANINKNKSLDVYSLVSLISGTEYENLIKEITQSIQKLLIDKENLLFQVTPNSENIKLINYQIENQKKLLIQSLDAVRLKYKSKYKNLLEKSTTYQSKLNKNPEDEVEFSRLNRLYSISEKYYTLLLERKTEFSISKAGYVSKNVILEKALGFGAKVSPNKKNAIIIALLVSFLFSIGLIFVRYIFHNKIYSLSDITKFSSGNVNFLGIIPSYRNEIPTSQLIVYENPKSQISEAFRNIRSNLFLIDVTEVSKIISITSSISGEGKTFVVINLAAILAFTGKKVIILDLDLRVPKIHNGFGETNAIGMSTILTGITGVDECIKNSPMTNLQFITSGPIPPNPSELILSDKLVEVITHLKKTYNYIVIDNAPVGMVTDGLVAMQMSDYPIYVFRAGYSKKIFTQNIDKLKNENNIKKLSVVLNDVDTTKKIYGYSYGYSYGYGYGYGYGQGYGYDSDNKKLKSKAKK
jgi:tyrosine-protein kinase Etk/Wzc